MRKQPPPPLGPHPSAENPHVLYGGTREGTGASALLRDMAPAPDPASGTGKNDRGDPVPQTQMGDVGAAVDPVRSRRPGARIARPALKTTEEPVGYAI